MKNDKYFSAGRVMTIEYKERNFDENKATFNLKVGDQTMEGVTLTELINTGESRYGIKCEFESDSEEDTEDTKRTDGRIVTYKRHSLKITIIKSYRHIKIKQTMRMQK